MNLHQAAPKWHDEEYYYDYYANTGKVPYDDALKICRAFPDGLDMAELESGKGCTLRAFIAAYRICNQVDHAVIKTKTGVDFAGFVSHTKRLLTDQGVCN